MEQKVIKIGNSLGILIPSKVIKKLKLHQGQVLNLELYEREKTLALRIDKNMAYGVTPEFIGFLKEFSDRYSDALTELARR